MLSLIGMLVCGQWIGEPKKGKLNFVRQVLLKNNENIAKQTLQQEMTIGINGLAHECNDVCSEISIPEITNINVLSKRQIKITVQKFRKA